MSPPRGRVLFVDLARAIAVLFMVQGHTLQVLLAPSYQVGPIHLGWLYLRGLTSCAFLLLAGFSFSLATLPKWDEHQSLTPIVTRRLRRLGLFLLLGYAMRIPIRPLSDFWRVTSAQWQAFAVVDILQLVALSLGALQLAVRLARTPRRFAIGAGAAASAIVLVSPLAWAVDWNRGMSPFLAAYLSSSSGSLFPIFPWAAYILFGAVVGAWFVAARARDGAPRAGRAFLLGGAALIASGVVLHNLPIAPYGAIDFWRISPNLFLVKAGSVLVLLAAAWRVTASAATLPPVLTALSRESLTVYLVHVCLLYGSIWNDGLYQAIGPRLGLAGTAGWAAILIGSMALLAWLWHACKHASWEMSAAIRTALAVVLVYVIT